MKNFNNLRTVSREELLTILTSKYSKFKKFYSNMLEKINSNKCLKDNVYIEYSNIIMDMTVRTRESLIDSVTYLIDDKFFLFDNNHIYTRSGNYLGSILGEDIKSITYSDVISHVRSALYNENYTNNKNLDMYNYLKYVLDLVEDVYDESYNFTCILNSNNQILSITDDNNSLIIIPM